MARTSFQSLAIATALLAAACSGGGSGGGGGAATSAITGGSTSGGSTSAGGVTTGVPAQPPIGQWLKGDLHVHSEHSDDSGSYGNDSRGLVGMGEYAGLDYMMISDHRQTTILQDPVFQQAQAQSFMTVIPGMEWGGPGHAGAHGLTRTPVHVSQTGSDAAAMTQSINDAIADVQLQGGIFVLNHPADPRNLFGWPAQNFDGIEVWNTLWAMRSVHDSSPQDLADWAARKGLAASGLAPSPELAAAVQHQGGGKNAQAVKFWEEHLNAGRHLAAVGGGDHHFLTLPGQPTTLVFAKSRSQADILQAIREARTMVARAPNAPVVDFRADANRDGVFESVIGDSMPLGQPVDFQIRVTDAVGGKVEFIKNGQIVQTFQVTQMDQTFLVTDTPTARSWYRLDVKERLDMSFPDASALKYMVMGVSGQSWINSLSGIGGIFSGIAGWALGTLNQVQDIVDTGGPAALWLLIRGSRMGVGFAPTPTRFPIIEWPEEVSQIINVDLQDDDFCKSVVTSPIWAE